MDDETRIKQGQRLASARRQAGFRSSRAAALENSWPESTYRAHEGGTRTIGQDDAEKYARAFQARGAAITAAEILFGGKPAGGGGGVPAPIPADIRPRPGHAPPPDFLGERDLPVFASAECGDGSMVVSTDPIDYVPRPWYLKQVRDGFAVLLTGTSMEPAYFAGDLAIINPKAAIAKGKDIIIIGGEEQGEFKASLKRYDGDNSVEWVLWQYNPPEGETHALRRFKHEWPRAMRVVGRYDGG